MSPVDRARVPWWAVAHLLSFAALALVAFRLQAPVAFFRFDGTFLLGVAENQATWMAAAGTFSLNPLEGNAGLWFPTATGLMPAFVAGRWIGGPAWYPAVAFAIFALEFYCATIALGLRAGFGWKSSTIGAWIVALGVCPFIVPPPAAERVWGNPHLLSAISINTFAIIAFWNVGAGTRLRSLAYATASFMLVFYLGICQPLATILSMPLYAFFGAVLTCMATREGERAAKAWALLAILMLYAALFGPFLAGMFGYAKTTFFWNELVPLHLSWRHLSFLLDPESQPRWLGRLLWPGAVVAGALLWRRSLGTTRPAIATFLGYIAILATATAIVVATGVTWRGPVPAYLDLFLLPLYALLLGGLVTSIPLPKGFSKSSATAALVALPWCVLATWAPPYDKAGFRNHIPYLWPPERTEVVAFLEREVGLRPAQAFRGRVVNLAGADFDPSLHAVPFGSQHNYDAMTLFFVHNDHRMYGLWHFGIPTLVENNQFSSPFFHYLTSRLLAEDGVLHTRPQTTLTKYDERTLRMLGVRYAITDQPLPGREPAMAFKVTDGRMQYLHAIPSPNVAGSSPVHVTLAGDATSALARLRDPAFDFAGEAVLFEALPPGTRLVPASAPVLKVNQDSFEVSASSTGTSLLVVPVEYTRCITTTLRDARGEPRLYRANLLQVGILFEGELRGTLGAAYSPLRHPGCRLDDLTDARRLLPRAPGIAVSDVQAR